MKNKFWGRVCIVSALMAAASHGAVDSIVYDTGTEWRVFASEGPSVCFTIQGATLWQATEKKLTTTNTAAKKAAFSAVSTVGTHSSAGIRAMATDSTGAVWLGSAEYLAYGKSAPTWTVVAKDQIPGGAVNVILPAPGAGSRVWVGFDEGLALFDNGTWKKFTKESGLRGNQVKSLAFDGRGGLWVGTNFGISVYLDGKWSAHHMDNGLSWNDTKALAFDERKNVMWAAVGDADVNCYDGKTWKVFMGVGEGVRALMVDTQSRMWLATATSVVKFNGEEWISDPAKLGVPAKLVTQMLRDARGNLWFAGENGVIYLKNPYPF